MAKSALKLVAESAVIETA